MTSDCRQLVSNCFQFAVQTVNSCFHRIGKTRGRTKTLLTLGQKLLQPLNLDKQQSAHSQPHPHTQAGQFLDVLVRNSCNISSKYQILKIGCVGSHRMNEFCVKLSKRITCSPQLANYVSTDGRIEWYSRDFHISPHKSLFTSLAKLIT